MAKSEDSVSKSQTFESAKLSVAPMMAWTDRHCRYFHRLLSQRALLYTEMVTAPALVRGGALHLLDHAPQEYPCALQLGGSDPAELGEAARIGAGAGFTEINLNCGCPSDRVQSGAFGAVLMKSPDLVAACVESMARAVDVPVTVKCRIGVDDQDPAEVLPDFLSKMQNAGVEHVTIHARKAWLKGLSPKENRDIPPLDYPLVHAMKRRFASMNLAINGGLATLGEAAEQLAHMDGAMVGRAAYHTPAEVLIGADARIWGQHTGLSAEESVAAMAPYIEAHIAAGGTLHQVSKHMLGLFSGRPGARGWRRVLSERSTQPGAGLDVLAEALDRVVGGSISAAE